LWLLILSRWKELETPEPPASSATGEEELLEGRVG
jgi:hypothetical protein